MSIAAKCTCGASFSYCNGDDRCQKKMPMLKDLTPKIDLRTYIATQSMQGYCSHYEYAQMDYDKLANAAVKQSDALIKRLNKEQ